MPVSDTEYLEWKRSGKGNPVVLVHATHSAGTEYFSDVSYRTRPDDTLDPIMYLSRLQACRLINGLGIGARGEIGVYNRGDINDWRDLAWEGYALQVYYGDQSWSRDDFRLEEDGINGGIEVLSPTAFRFRFRDRDEQLRVEVIGSGGDPIGLGEVFNARPKLIDAVNLDYRVHAGVIVSVNAVRDNGVPLALTTGYTETLSTGTIRLVNAPAGQITVDFTQADDTAEEMITDLCGRVSVDVDATNLAAFSNTDSLGLYVEEPTTVYELLRGAGMVLESVGALHRYNSDGDLQIELLEAPEDGSSELTLTFNDFMEDGLSHAGAEKPVETYTLGYQRNWAVQDRDSLASSVSAADKEKYSSQYQEVTSSNTTGYPEPELARRDTLLSAQADAQTEVDRLSDIRDEKRHSWRARCRMSATDALVGSVVTVKYPEYDLESGVQMLVRKVVRNYIDREVELSLWE